MITNSRTLRTFYFTNFYTLLVANMNNKSNNLNSLSPCLRDILKEGGHTICDIPLAPCRWAPLADHDARIMPSVMENDSSFVRRLHMTTVTTVTSESPKSPPNSVITITSESPESPPNSDHHDDVSLEKAMDRENAVVTAEADDPRPEASASGYGDRFSNNQYFEG